MGGGLALVLATQRPDAVAAGGRPVLRRDPVADGAARLVEAEAKVVGEYAELDGFAGPDAVRPSRRNCATGQGRHAAHPRGREHAFFNDARPEVYDAEAWSSPCSYLFDAGGVLVLPDPTVLAPLLAVYGGAVDVEVHRRAHYAGWRPSRVRAPARPTGRSYDEAYVRVVGVADRDVDEAAHVLGRTRTAHLWRWPIADSVAALPSSSARGRPIGVVSNASGQVEAALRRPGVPGGGGCRRTRCCVIDSHVVGVAKPDPAIFDHALVHFDGVERARIAYVGDSVTMDVGGARAAGLHPILLDPYDDHPDLDADRIRTSASCSTGSAHADVRSGRVARSGASATRRRAITLRQSVSSAPSKIDSTRASTNSRLTVYSSA
jgi:FMN phosphatase YigB (HAD superfamily)